MLSVWKQGRRDNQETLFQAQKGVPDEKKWERGKQPKTSENGLRRRSIEI